MQGFANHHATEALPGALPRDQNSPQQPPLGLYAEQISGSAFTRPRAQNLHSWLYRMLPSTVQADYTYYGPATQAWLPLQPPNPLRWSPMSNPTNALDFIDGLWHLAGNTDLHSYIYQCTASMEQRYYSNYDGELLFIPYQGEIKLRTEMGILALAPGMIAVVPRGIRFTVELLTAQAAGYLCENGGVPLTLPELGFMGANALANPRHFLYPHAAYETIETDSVSLICKYQNHLWQTTAPHSPLNVVAWHGNYAPYSYDLSLFNTINTVSFDHPDPSIFTVLTSPSPTTGVAHLDFVIFPSRWMVAEHSFRLPYYHRNVMNEMMGLIEGAYDAKKTGFSVGGVSIHNCMTAHGPDADGFAAASHTKLIPQHYEHTLAFMFESCLPWLVTKKAFDHHSREKTYSQCWQGLSNHFAHVAKPR